MQETVSLLKSKQSLKMTIGADAELCLPIWHCRTRKAFLMHVSSALDTIKKRGTFKAYKEAHQAYVEQREAAREAKANMQLFATTASEGEKANKKGLRRLPLRLLGRTALRKRRLLRRRRKARLWPTLQPQIFVRSTRRSTRKPPLQKRPPRSTV